MKKIQKKKNLTKQLHKNLTMKQKALLLMEMELHM